MAPRLLLLLIFLASCAGLNEMGCPRVKVVKLNRKPSNYMKTHYRSLSASNRVTERERDNARDIKLRQRPVKTVSIEEWDCPKPGSPTPLPKAVRENIRKNRKKFDSYYKNRVAVDSVSTTRFE